jgi:hypothetical protein
MKYVFSAFALLALSAQSFAQSQTTSLDDEAPSSHVRITNPSSITNVAKTDDFGVGLTLGNVSGLNAKYWATENSAIGMGVGFAANNVALNGDYLYHFRNAFMAFSDDDSARAFVPYIGIGAIVGFGSGTNNFFNTSNAGTSTLAARIPFGLEYLPRSAPVGIYGELAPGLGLAPGGFGFLQADVGGRWYF